MKYNELGKTGILISEICLGTMTFGGKGYWQAIGQVPQDDVTQIVKTSLDSGINFIDTANAYSEGLAEILLGEALIKLGIPRSEIFIATKVRIRMGKGANQVGLSRLHIMDSVNESLQRMKLSHIDLLYIHGVDPLTPLEETMRGLEDIVRSGKARYIGVSNHPAWMVMKANGYAETMGWTKFVASQNYYTIAGRDIEREIIPMAQSEGISIIPWSPLAGGFLSGKFRRNIIAAGNSRRDSFDFPPINKEKAYNIIDIMDVVAKQHDVSIAAVALNWVIKRPGITSTIIGAKNLQQLNENINATNLQMTSEEVQRLDEVSILASEYPGWMIGRQLQGRWPS
ncbi:MAG: aldo/keto reductase [Bacteroidales bacterium]|jgi:aryl-alcohol dehydrogenase-like predicted oxidoreductase